MRTRARGRSGRGALIITDNVTPVIGRSQCDQRMGGWWKKEDPKEMVFPKSNPSAGDMGVDSIITRSTKANKPD